MANIVNKSIVYHMVRGNMTVLNIAEDGTYNYVQGNTPFLDPYLAIDPNTNPLANGQQLVYNSTTEKWSNRTPVHMIASPNTALTFPNPVSFGTTISDTHSAINTTADDHHFIIPFAGTYRIEYSFNTVNSDTSAYITINNGTDKYAFSTNLFSGSTTVAQNKNSVTLTLNQADRIRWYFNSAVDASNNVINHMSVTLLF